MTSKRYIVQRYFAGESAASSRRNARPDCYVVYDSLRLRQVEQRPTRKTASDYARYLNSKIGDDTKAVGQSIWTEAALQYADELRLDRTSRCEIEAYLPQGVALITVAVINRSTGRG